MLNKENRKLYEGVCDHCSSKTYKRKEHYLNKNHNFCNLKCKGLFFKTGVNKKCSHCSKLIYKRQSEISRSKRGNFFCNRSCATSFHNKLKIGDKHPNFKDGNSRYRKRALKHYGEECMNTQCDLSSNKIQVSVKLLDVDHINGDRSDSSITNLQVLCVWCHAKKTRNVG